MSLKITETNQYFALCLDSVRTKQLLFTLFDYIKGPIESAENKNYKT